MASHANVELIPGTEIMNANGKAEKALIPHPSSDPRDPLNWSMRWKRAYHSNNVKTYAKISQSPS